MNNKPKIVLLLSLVLAGSFILGAVKAKALISPDSIDCNLTCANNNYGGSNLYYWYEGSWILGATGTTSCQNQFLENGEHAWVENPNVPGHLCANTSYSSE